MRHYTSQGMMDYEVPHEMTISEIKQTIKDFGKAAKNAIAAGFDGVQLHAANGYLPSQFLAESANRRTDDYGGGIANNTRFVIEIMQELISAVGSEKVGIKISPFHPYGDIILDDPAATYNFLIGEMNKLDFAHVEIMRRSPQFPPPENYVCENEIEYFGRKIRQTVIANGGYDKSSAEDEIEKGIAALISFGTLYIANPDLPHRFEKNAELGKPDRTTMFGGGEHGYVDYPFMQV